MRRMLRFLAVLLFAGTGLPAATARAQYIFLDSNGDGVHTTADRMNANGTATTADVWLRTDHNRDGSLATCDTGDGNLTFNSYVVNLHATGGTVTYTNYINQQSQATVILQPLASNTADFTVGRGSGTISPPGDYKLMTVTITGQAGTPSVAIVGDNAISAPNSTSFGTFCSGNDFDNTYKLLGTVFGTGDWADADGLLAQGGDAPPVITAPSTANGAENSAISVSATASDAEGQALTLSQTNNAPFLPSPTSTGPIVNPTLALAGTPNFDQAGNYQITWTAVESGSPGQSTTSITNVLIAPTNRNPVINAPAIVSGLENAPISITGAASDPDAHGVTLSQSNNAPFLFGPSSVGPVLNPSITLTGTPNFTQAGSYTINWSATDVWFPAGTAAATTAVSIGGPDRAPVVNAPATFSGIVGTPLTVSAGAADPDGETVTLCVNKDGATFLAGPTCAGPSLNPVLTISGTPTMAGTFTLTWTATNALTTTVTTILSISPNDAAPVLNQPSAMTVNEGMTAAQQLTASDPDNDPLIFSKVGMTPFFMSVSASGLVTLTPSFTDAGNYAGAVQVSDGTLSDSKSFNIFVINVNRCPTANPGGPYSALLGVPANLNGSASSDLDGDPLTYDWDFGDGVNGTGPTPTHVYTTLGTFNVSLTVNDGTCVDVASTIVTVGQPFTNAFTAGGNNKTSLGAGKPFTCVQIEPVGGSFSVSDVDLASIVMISPGTGSVSEISAAAGKTSVGADKNGNGVEEITACFAKEDLRQLFSGLPNGNNVVHVSLEGNLTNGGRFHAELDHVVKSTGGALAATITPNPLNPTGKVSFATTKPGALRVQMFDLKGRLVRTITDESAAPSGYHDLTIDGRDGNGVRLASGVYYVRIWSSVDGAETISFTLLK